MPSLSTHVLDLYHGKPAHGVKIEVRYQPIEGNSWTTIKTVKTNTDGRCDEQIITENDWQSGHYELVFDVGSYFAQQSINLPDPSFLSFCFFCLRNEFRDPCPVRCDPVLLADPVPGISFVTDCFICR